MHALLTDASDALMRNDADTLERLCVQAEAARAPSGGLSADERAAYAQALLCFQRQVLAARSNLVLRQRLLAAHAPKDAPWAR